MKIQYGEHPENFGILRVPETQEPPPVIVVIHGGMWRVIYNLDYMEPVCEELTAEGWATWNIEYRRVGNGGGFPTTFQDVARAVDFVRELAPRFKLDLTRVIVMGHSAGGHLALWVAARHCIAPASELYETGSNALQPRAVISLAGITNLSAGLEQNMSNGIVKELIGGTRQEFSERYAATSPAELLPIGVRQLLIHGTNDDSVPYPMSEDYRAAAVELGDDVTLVTLPGAGHFEMVTPGSREWVQVVETIQSVLR